MDERSHGMRGWWWLRLGSSACNIWNVSCTGLALCLLVSHLLLPVPFYLKVAVLLTLLASCLIGQTVDIQHENGSRALRWVRSYGWVIAVLGLASYELIRGGWDLLFAGHITSWALSCWILLASLREDGRRDRARARAGRFLLQIANRRAERIGRVLTQTSADLKRTREALERAYREQGALHERLTLLEDEKRRQNRELRNAVGVGRHQTMILLKGQMTRGKEEHLSNPLRVASTYSGVVQKSSQREERVGELLQMKSMLRSQMHEGSDLPAVQKELRQVERALFLLRKEAQAEGDFIGSSLPNR